MLSQAGKTKPQRGEPDPPAEISNAPEEDSDSWRALPLDPLWEEYSSYNIYIYVQIYIYTVNIYRLYTLVIQFTYVKSLWQ